MPTVAVKLYSFLFKFTVKHRLQSRIGASPDEADPSGVTSRPEDAVAPANPTFSDGVATKDIHVDDPRASLSLRLFLPETALSGSDSKSRVRVNRDDSYGGYSPSAGRSGRRLPVLLQFHGGGFVSGSNNSVANDVFCRRIAKLCDVVVVAVGYRLAPENRYPAAFEDGVRALHWVGKQANLADWSRSQWKVGRDTMNDNFGASMVEPWLAAHGDPSRYCI